MSKGNLQALCQADRSAQYLPMAVLKYIIYLGLVSGD